MNKLQFRFSPGVCNLVTRTFVLKFKKIKFCTSRKLLQINTLQSELIRKYAYLEFIPMLCDSRLMEQKINWPFA